MDKMLEQLDATVGYWNDTIRHIPITTHSIIPLTKIWSSNIEEQIDVYTKDIQQKAKDFKTRVFWEDNITPTQVYICILYYTVCICYVIFCILW